MPDIMTDPAAHTAAAFERNQQRAAHLHALADWLAAHPELDPYHVQFGTDSLVVKVYGIVDRDELAAIARAVGGRWDKHDDDLLFRLTREILDGVTVDLVVNREAVCEWVTTGEETVEIVEPDPDLVAQLPTVTRIETRKVGEWQCKPVLPGVEAA